MEVEECGLSETLLEIPMIRIKESVIKARLDGTKYVIKTVPGTNVRCNICKAGRFINVYVV